jgi:hypothetical protein
LGSFLASPYTSTSMERRSSWPKSTSCAFIDH